MTSSRWLFTAVLLFAGCRNLDLPPRPGPGSLTGRVVVAEPGTGRMLPAVGAYVELKDTNLSARTNDDGRFSLGPLPSRDGTVSLRLDADGDGRFERQKLLTLASLSPPPNGDITAGELVLSENAILRGRIILGDLPADTGGHGGIFVFVPESPYATVTSDDGEFILRDLPDGALTVSAYKTGYQPVGVAGIRLQPGQVVDLAPLSLAAAASVAPAAITGKVQKVGASDASGLTVKLLLPMGSSSDPAAVVATATTAADGSYSFPGVAAGLFDLEISGTGIATARLYNVLINGAAQVSTVSVAEGQSSGSGASASDGGIALSGNRAPVARTADVHAAAGVLVTLDATDSSDPDEDPLRYTWQQVSGTPVVLSLYDSPLGYRTQFTAPVTSGQLQFLLRVTDALGAFDQKTVNVSLNVRPVAVLPQSAVGAPGSTLTLNGTGSYDPDHTGTLTYLWTLVPQADGGVPAVTLTGPTTAQPTLVAPAGGVLFKVRLVVSDGDLSSDPAEMYVYSSSVNLAPLAAAGPDFDVDWSQTLLLDGTASSDPNGDPITFQWTFTNGSIPCGSFLSTQDGGTVLYKAPNAQCDASITLLVKDPSAQFGSDQLTIRVSDRQPPAVTASSPNGGPGSAFGPVSFTFNREIQASPPPQIIVTDADGGVLPGATSYDSNAKALSFVPKQVFPAGETLTATTGTIVSTTGVDGGSFSFGFTANEPTMTGTTTVTSGTSTSWYNVFPVAGNAGERFVNFNPLGNGDQTWHVVPTAPGAPFNGAQGFVGGVYNDTVRLRAEPLNVFWNGRAYFYRHYTDSGCTSTNMAATCLGRMSGVLTTNTPNWARMTNPQGFAGFPASVCSVTRSAAATVDRNQALLISTVDEQPTGTLNVRMFRCPNCVTLPDNTLAGTADWSQLAQLAYTTTTAAETLSGLSMDAHNQAPVVVWTSQSATGKKIRGATYDFGTTTWTPLANNIGGADLNLADDGLWPTVRWLGNDLLLAYWQTNGTSTDLKVLRYSGGLWTQLGGAINSTTPEFDRIPLTMVGDTIFVSWAEAAGTTHRPHVKWYDARTNTWKAPINTGPEGEIGMGTNCYGLSSFMSPFPEGTGLMMAYAENCVTSGATSSVLMRDIR